MQRSGWSAHVPKQEGMGRSPRTPRLLPVLAVAVSALTVPAPAGAASSGGASAGDTAGGSAYGTASARVSGARPVARLFSVSPRSVTLPALPTVRLRVDQPGTSRVHARLVFWPRGGGAVVARADLGWIRTGRNLRVRWPAGMTVAPGRYLVRLHVKDRAERTLARSAATSGRANLTVRAARRRASATPAPAATSAPLSAATPLAPGTYAFPVAGPHTLGGEGARFGAGRTGHLHQGHDVPAAEGTPVVAPVAGTVRFTEYQPGGAGYYVVLDGTDGRSYFFAHCQKDSFAAPAGTAVAVGGPLCNVGQTGSATGPHLHFEIWLGGWRVDEDSRPIDPLPDLLAWGG
jgi:murein DD-endopeptidase MepM/ murein hydrolase activator NlpD